MTAGAWNGHSIPTEYNGTKFLSRTEARWAVFMDQLGVKWFYEHEGFQLTSGWYLPDFWIPSLEVFLEIKGVPPSEEMHLRCGQLSAVTKRRALLFIGSPAEQDNDGTQNWYDSESAFVYQGGDSYLDFHYLWCKCPGCGKYGIEFDGRGGRICSRKVGDHALHFNSCTKDTDSKHYSYDHPSLIRARELSKTWNFFAAGGY